MVRSSADVPPTTTVSSEGGGRACASSHLHEHLGTPNTPASCTARAEMTADLLPDGVRLERSLRAGLGQPLAQYLGGVGDTQQPTSPHRSAGCGERAEEVELGVADTLRQLCRLLR